MRLSLHSLLPAARVGRNRRSIPAGVWYLISVSGLVGILSVFLQFLPFFFEAAGLDSRTALIGSSIGCRFTFVVLLLCLCHRCIVYAHRKCTV